MPLDGWIRFWRHQLDDARFQLKPYIYRVYIWFYFRASFRDRTIVVGGCPIELGQGEVMVGCQTAERQLSLHGEPFSRKMYRTAIKTLEKVGLITTRRALGGTIVRITDYAVEQSPCAGRDAGNGDELEGAEGRALGQSQATAGPSSGPPPATSREEKNGEKSKTGKKESEEVYSRPAGGDKPEDLLLQEWTKTGLPIPKITQVRQAKLSRILSIYSLNELLDAIRLYAQVLNNPDSYYSYRHAIDDFFKEEILDRFRGQRPEDFQRRSPKGSRQLPSLGSRLTADMYNHPKRKQEDSN